MCPHNQYLSRLESCALAAEVSDIAAFTANVALASDAVRTHGFAAFDPEEKTFLRAPEMTVASLYRRMFKAIGRLDKDAPVHDFVDALMDSALPVAGLGPGHGLAGTALKWLHGPAILERMHDRGVDLKRESEMNHLVHEAMLSFVAPEDAHAVDLLVRAGCDINEPGGINRFTPLQFLVSEKSPFMDSKLVVLLRHGADLDARGGKGKINGRTPLELALHLGHPHHARRLYESGARLHDDQGLPLVRVERLKGEAQQLACSWVARAKARTLAAQSQATRDADSPSLSSHP